MAMVSVDPYYPIAIPSSNSRFRCIRCRIEESFFGFTYQDPVLLLLDSVPQDNDFVLVKRIEEFKVARYSKGCLHFPDNLAAPLEPWILSIIGIIVPLI